MTISIFFKQHFQKCASLVLASALTLFALAQLFAFEALPHAFEQLFATTALSGWLIAASLVTAEVLALPFLLGLHTSRQFRTISMILGWVALSMLFVITTKELGANQVASLLLGVKIPMPAGVWNTVLIALLGVLAAWIAVRGWHRGK